MLNHTNNEGLFNYNFHDVNKLEIDFTELTSNRNERYQLSEKLGESFKDGDIGLSVTWRPLLMKSDKLITYVNDQTRFYSIMQQFIDSIVTNITKSYEEPNYLITYESEFGVAEHISCIINQPDRELTSYYLKRLLEDKFYDAFECEKSDAIAKYSKVYALGVTANIDDWMLRVLKPFDTKAKIHISGKLTNEKYISNNVNSDV